MSELGILFPKSVEQHQSAYTVAEKNYSFGDVIMSSSFSNEDLSKPVSHEEALLLDVMAEALLL